MTRAVYLALRCAHVKELQLPKSYTPLSRYNRSLFGL